MGLAVGVWVISVFVQAGLSINVEFSLFLGGSCQLTGLPIADCLYNSSSVPFWVIHSLNIFLWFILFSIIGSFIKRK